MTTALIILAALSLAATIGQGISSHFSQKKANEFNQEQYEDWKSYNTPEQQMERLGQAGLNPYMVSGVNNTLSQPFAVGQNTGLSELFSGIGQSARGTMSTLLGQERNDIAQTNAATKKTEADIHSRLADMRERMVILAEKRNDPMMALLWGQADAQTIANMVLRNSSDDILKLRHYQALRAAEDYDFISKMHPMQLDMYQPFQRARINQLLSSSFLSNAQASHLKWYEDFALSQLLQQDRHWRNDRQDKYFFFSTPSANEAARLRLSRDYYDLARDKFQWSILNDIVDKAFPFKLKGITKGGAGQFPSWTEYEYGY